MKDGKTISERMRGLDNDSCTGDLLADMIGIKPVCGGIDCSECVDELLVKVADEIDAEVAAARDTPKWYEGFRVFVGEELERPMEDGDGISGWLHRNYIAIPTDKEGKPWAIGDACQPSDTDLPGEVIGFTVGKHGRVLVRVATEAYDEIYAPGALSRIVPDTQERINEDARKSMSDYWGCAGVLCSECPARIDGASPPERFGVGGCIKAQSLDLLRRQRELDKAGAPCQ